MSTQWVDQLINGIGQATSPVIELALASKDSQRFRGRASVATWNCAAFNAPLVVRRCSHGGFWRHFAGDRYMGNHRARIEIEHSQRILKLGIATPEVVGVVLYKSGLFQRMDLLTIQVPNSVDFVAFLAARPMAHRRDAALAAVRDYLARTRGFELVAKLGQMNELWENIAARPPPEEGEDEGGGKEACDLGTMALKGA